MVPIGIIGCGHIAQVAHLPAAEKSERIRIAALCDRSETIVTRVGARYHVDNVTTSVPKLLADPDIEAVVVAVPDRLHVEVVSAALAAGKHVLVEKPLAESSDDCRRLIRAADASGRILQVACMKRHDPGVVAAQRHLRTAGDVVAFNAWYRVPASKAVAVGGYLPLQYGDPDVRLTEAAAKADRQKYLLATHGSHIFDTIRYLLGDVRSVFARHSANGKDHAWQGSMVLDSGGLGTFELLANVHGPWAEGIEVHTSAGTVSVNTHVPFAHRASDLRIFDDNTLTWSESFAAAADSYQEQMEAFASAVRGERMAEPNGDDGLAAVRLIEAVAISCSTGEEVHL